VGIVVATALVSANVVRLLLNKASAMTIFLNLGFNMGFNMCMYALSKYVVCIV
jgi:hypothetical protein